MQFIQETKLQIQTVKADKEKEDTAKPRHMWLIQVRNIPSISKLHILKLRKQMRKILIHP